MTYSYRVQPVVDDAGRNTDKVLVTILDRQAGPARTIVIGVDDDPAMAITHAMRMDQLERRR